MVQNYNKQEFYPQYDIAWFADGTSAEIRKRVPAGNNDDGEPMESLELYPHKNFRDKNKVTEDNFNYDTQTNIISVEIPSKHLIDLSKDPVSGKVWITWDCLNNQPIVLDNALYELQIKLKNAETVGAEWMKVAAKKDTIIKRLTQKEDLKQLLFDLGDDLKKEMRDLFLSAVKGGKGSGSQE